MCRGVNGCLLQFSELQAGGSALQVWSPSPAPARVYPVQSSGLSCAAVLLSRVPPLTILFRLCTL